MLRNLLILLAVLLAPSLRAQSAEPIQILYNPRPPYMTPAGGDVVGVTADAAAFAFRKAGIPFRWVEIPSSRQLFIIKENRARVAALGWFKNPERETFARFSSPLYQDRQIAVLARKDNTRIASATSVDSLLRARDITLLVKAGYSYGSFLDDRIARLEPVVSRVTVENLNMIQMIRAGRADYMFIAPEEAEATIDFAHPQANDLRLLTLTDMPHGEKRYLMFSLQVDDNTIRQINKHIEAFTAARK